MRATTIQRRKPGTRRGGFVPRSAILATVCLAVFAINIDITVVNIALPQLGRQLHASTEDLQWIVDGYNLAFAALVLTAGSLGDRFGRRPALLIGLAGFAASSAIGALVGSSTALIVVRFAMGAFAALIYPTTLSVINNIYPVRSERLKAIGIWGAVTGVGVAVGPVAGGLLLSHYRWPAVFVALVPVAVVAFVLTFALVPESSHPGEVRLDPAGLITSSAAVGLLVYTIIEAPQRGWLSAATVVGFVLTVALIVSFVVLEHRNPHPMVDTSLFKQPAFSAASGAVTVSYFALYGFIFIITQYFQVVRGWSALSSGLRFIPVAATIAIGSVAGARLSARFGTRQVVVAGLLIFGAAFAWIAIAATFRTYWLIIAQELLLGLGLGLTSTPATDSILSVLPPAKTGLGSAVNDATREAGGTLGVAVIGSVFTSIYIRKLTHTSFAQLPAGARDTAQSSLAAATATVAHATGALHPQLLHGFNDSFMTGLHAACVVGAGVCWLGGLASLALPGRRQDTAESMPDTNLVVASGLRSPP